MDCQAIIDSYLKWIKDNTEIRSIRDGQSCEITTPFMDRHNDHLQIYITKKDNNLMLTDDGYILQDLSMSGMNLDTPKRKQLFQSVLNGFGVKVDDYERIYVDANITNIGQKKHALLQALLAVNDMYTLSQESISSFFKEDVEQFFNANEIYYAKDIKIAGKTGFDHTIDFLISATRTMPERLIKAINKPTKDHVMASIFSFSDIAEIRDRKPKNFVIYNDVDWTVSKDVLSALGNYGVNPMPWSQKATFRSEFAAN